MLTAKDRKEIRSLMQQEIIPAVGCTEPIAVSLCTARATEVLGEITDKVDVYLSTNILKNAMGVGIPGTGMNGLPIAIALGATRGKSEKGLELLDNLSPLELDQGKRFIRDKIININIKENISEKLYIEVQCTKKGNKSI
ncbi:MAG: serine dehydratase subunit alpha family protein, partial [Fermentimonas sp.]|nr:serine dehydratase subunit alpha family protein [Fermentimonas sp.]